MLMLDLFAGMGGASAAMRDRGWEVITVDVEPRFGCTYTLDVREFLDVYTREDGRRPDLLWASPPCTEFSRTEKPFQHVVLDMPSSEALDLVFEVSRVVRVLRPRFWILENVRGAQRWIGRAAHHVGAFYLWGWFPFHRLNLPHAIGYGKTRVPPGPNRAALRAKIPYALSLRVAQVVEEELGGSLWSKPENMWWTRLK